MKKTIIFFSLVLFLTSCAARGNMSLKWAQAGPDFTHSVKKNIEVFEDEAQIKREFAYFGKVFTEGKESDKMKKDFEKIAAANGADAVLIHKSFGKITGYAIKYTDDLTEEDRQSIRNFNAVNTVRD
jgi:hypothetical protein